jgi:(2Fe-2S) ferredoxin
MGKSNHQQSEFVIEGRFLSFATKDSYKLKYIKLAANADEYLIKIPKELRSTLYRRLTPGIWLQVAGQQTFSENGAVKLKAYQITPIAVPSEAPAAENLPCAVAPMPVPAQAGGIKKTSILVCQKSDCCKRGGRALMAALQTELDQRGLSDQVAIKPTGCMKDCKAGPNLVMPGKTRYSRIQSADVPALLDKHFPTPVATAALSQ